LKVLRNALHPLKLFLYMREGGITVSICCAWWDAANLEESRWVESVMQPSQGNVT